MSAYETIIGLLAEVAEEPEVSAMDILTALRTIPDEVAQAGVAPKQWEAACEAMIAIAYEAAQARQDREAERHRQAWPEMAAALERAGCSVTRRIGATWRVMGTGIAIDIDLDKGAVEYSEGEGGEQLPEFEDIVEHIIRAVRSRETKLADLARRMERRKTHQWDNKKKVWLPRSGVGAIIRAGQ
jgi:hypothetical protein